MKAFDKVLKEAKESLPKALEKPIRVISVLCGDGDIHIYGGGPDTKYQLDIKSKVPKTDKVFKTKWTGGSIMYNDITYDIKSFEVEPFNKKSFLIKTKDYTFSFIGEFELMEDLFKKAGSFRSSCTSFKAMLNKIVIK